MTTIGIIANPMSGKDIRRLVAHASPTSDAAKVGVVRRAVLGAISAGATRILLSPDSRNLCARAIEGIDTVTKLEVLDAPTHGRSSDSTLMASRMRTEEAGAVIVLGGDGTSRDVAKGWLDAPILALSTGTNNVFPRSIEATVAGSAAALFASELFTAAERDTLAERTNVLHATINRSAGSTEDDLALVDIALVEGHFTGSRAVWEVDGLRSVIAAIAEPDTVGLSTVAAMCLPKSRSEAGAVLVHVGKGEHVVTAPVAPGSYVDIPIRSAELLPDGGSTTFSGPGVLSFDGERDCVLHVGDTATVTVHCDGPFVISPGAVLRAAVAARAFLRPSTSFDSP